MGNHFLHEPFVQDFVECEWIATSPSPNVVYVSNVGESCIFASGIIKYTSGKSDSAVTITFLHNGKIIGSPIEVFLDNNVTFTISKFNEISVTPSAASEDEPAEGVMFLSTRYPFIDK